MSQPISTRLIRRQSSGMRTNANRPTPAARKSRQRTRTIRKGFDHLYWVICLVLAISNTQVERAYVELREDDDDGCWSCCLLVPDQVEAEQQELEREIVRKARYALKRASAST